MSKKFDVLFLHPLTTFRKYLINTPYLPSHYPMLPMGLFSLAAILEKEGYQVRIINIGLEVLLQESFDVENFVRSIDADVYAIDLHWIYHSEGAIQLSQLCKKYHPDSLVILGGFTASWFCLDILRNYGCIDAIVLGEGEESMPKLVRSFLHGKSYAGVKGLAYRDDSTVKIAQPVPPNSLEEFEFTKLALLKNWKHYLRVSPGGYISNDTLSFWITIGRGCKYNCIYCGGSHCSYRLVTNRSEPIFRSPDKVVQDILRLEEVGIEKICFSHDIEMVNNKYALDLLQEIKKNRVDMQVYWEASQLPTRGFLEKIKQVFYEVEVAIYPLSPNENVRIKAGKMFTNNQFFNIIKLCEKLGILTDVHFVVGLPYENSDFYKLFQKIVDQLTKYRHIMISPLSLYTLDPTSKMAICPQEYGIKIYLKDFQDYMSISSSPYIVDRIGYETPLLSREKIIEITNKANEYISAIQNQNTLHNNPSSRQV